MRIKKVRGPGGKRALFAMAFHCYQPAFNFEWEIEKAYENSYMPLLRAVEEFSSIKASFHFSGNTLEWIAAKRPEAIVLLHRLILNGQVEILGGGYYEPILDIIPERDRRGQIRKNTEVIERFFGVKPKGAWLTEKVWDQAISGSLLSSGIKYTIIDDHHLLKAGIDEHKVYRPCETGESGEKIVVFPSLTRLRYYMPFRLPRVTLDFMRQATEDNPFETSCFFFADDGEKFGAWPYTYKWVHQRGWLRNFFRMLTDNGEWLRTATYSEVMGEEAAEDVGSIPPSSYAEMTDWSGGNFKNFFTRYPESGRMHERMLDLSDSIEAAEKDEENTVPGYVLDEARDELFRSQCSCAYWHGTFGGLYLPHLRQGVYRHLITGKKLLDDAMVPGVGSAFRSETLLKNSELEVYSSGIGGSVAELDLVSDGINITNMMSRTEEGYHDKLKRGYFSRMKRARKAILKGEFPDIHDVLGVKTRGLKRLLDYDDYQRTSFLTHIFTDGRSWKSIDKDRKSIDVFLNGGYAGRRDVLTEEMVYSKRQEVPLADKSLVDLEVTKRIGLGKGKKIAFSQILSKHSDGKCVIWGGVEFNFSVWDDNLSLKKRWSTTDHVVLRDKFFDTRIEISLDGECSVLTYPVYTVNETESGLTKVYQGLSVLIGGPARLEGRNESETLDIVTNIG